MLSSTALLVFAVCLGVVDAQKEARLGGHVAVYVVAALVVRGRQRAVVILWAEAGNPPTGHLITCWGLGAGRTEEDDLVA